MSEIEAGVEGRAWTRREVELVVSVYLHMLRMQLMGQTPNKAEHNRQLQQKQGSESTFQQVVGFDGDLFRPADLLWPEFPSLLSFDRKAEAVGAVDALMLKVPADGVGFFGIDGLHDEFPIVSPPLFGGTAQARQCRMRGDRGIGCAEGVAAMAGPGVVGGVGDHLRAKRVQFDVAVTLQQVAIIADGTCLVASFP